MKKGWITLIPLVLAACQKSPGAYERGVDEQGAPSGGAEQGAPSGGAEQGGADGSSGTEQPDQPGTDGREGMQGQMPGGDMGGQQPGGTDGVGQRPATDPQGMSAAVQTLQQDVQQLRSAAQLQHTDLAKALRDFSAALQSLPQAGTTLSDAVSRIGSYADRIEAAGATSNMQSRWAQRALNEGLDALGAYQKERNLTDMADRLEGIKGQVGQINPEQPFAQQKDAFVNALEQISGVLVDVSAPPTEPGTR